MPLTIIINYALTYHIQHIEMCEKFYSIYSAIWQLQIPSTQYET